MQQLTFFLATFFCTVLIATFPFSASSYSIMTVFCLLYFRRLVGREVVTLRVLDPRELLLWIDSEPRDVEGMTFEFNTLPCVSEDIDGPSIVDLCLDDLLTLRGCLSGEGRGPIGIYISTNTSDRRSSTSEVCTTSIKSLQLGQYHWSIGTC